MRRERKVCGRWPQSAVPTRIAQAQHTETHEACTVLFDVEGSPDALSMVIMAQAGVQLGNHLVWLALALPTNAGERHFSAGDCGFSAGIVVSRVVATTTRHDWSLYHILEQSHANNPHTPTRSSGSTTGQSARKLHRAKAVVQVVKSHGGEAMDQLGPNDEEVRDVQQMDHEGGPGGGEHGFLGAPPTMVRQSRTRAAKAARCAGRGRRLTSTIALFRANSCPAAASHCNLIKQRLLFW